MAKRHSPIPALLVSLILGFLLSMLPLPATLQSWRPEWVSVILIFWALHAPATVGIWTGVFCGFLLDILLVTPLGLHASVFAAQLYVVHMMRRWTGVFSIRQTTGLVFGLLMAGRVIQYVELQLLSLPPTLHDYFLPAMAGALIWPTIMLSLRRWTQR